ncbi:MAG: flagellar motor protein MotB [Lachnospiraceae bacterium]|nr:flagellar motor protein MotB [Lachnospiraceae bacterium]
MARRRKEDPPAAGSPAWMATFGDLMNLLLCFFVLLFSMSRIDEEKYNQLVASMSSAFSILNGGATAIGEGILISNGVSQLNELDQYINSTGNTADDTVDSEDFNDFESGEVSEEEKFQQMLEEIKEHNTSVNEQLAEIIEETVEESNMSDKIDVTFTSQYVMLSLKGALLFDSGEAQLREDALPVMERVGVILERYAGSTIEIEGHTDTVPMSNKKFANNNELSSARALSVFDYLVENTFLDPADIKHAGRGEYVPVADNSTAEGRAKNRRVEIRIYNPVIQ